MNFGDIWTAIEKGSIAVAGLIAKGGLGKTGANIVGDRFAKFNSSKSADDLEDENRYYCPFCGFSIDIDRRREICLGCQADVIYGKTEEEKNGEAFLMFLFGGFITYLILIAFPKLLNFIFKWNIASRFGLSIFSSLYLGLLITFCVGIIFIYLENKADCQQRIRCRRYHSSANEYRYRDVEKLN